MPSGHPKWSLLGIYGVVIWILRWLHKIIFFERELRCSLQKYKAHKTQWFSCLWLSFWSWRRGVSASSGFNPCRIWRIRTKLVIGRANSLSPSSFVLYVLGEFFVSSMWVLYKQFTTPLSTCRFVTFVFKSLKQWCIFPVSLIGTFLGWFQLFQMYLMQIWTYLVQFVQIRDTWKFRLISVRNLTAGNGRPVEQVERATATSELRDWTEDCHNSGNQWKIQRRIGWRFQRSIGWRFQRRIEWRIQWRIFMNSDLVNNRALPCPVNWITAWTEYFSRTNNWFLSKTAILNEYFTLCTLIIWTFFRWDNVFLLTRNRLNVLMCRKNSVWILGCPE